MAAKCWSRILSGELFGKLKVERGKRKVEKYVVPSSVSKFIKGGILVTLSHR